MVLHILLTASMLQIISNHIISYYSCYSCWRSPFSTSNKWIAIKLKLVNLFLLISHFIVQNWYKELFLSFLFRYHFVLFIESLIGVHSISDTKQLFLLTLSYWLKQSFGWKYAFLQFVYNFIKCSFYKNYKQIGQKLLIEEKTNFKKSTIYWVLLSSITYTIDRIDCTNHIISYYSCWMCSFSPSNKWIAIKLKLINLFLQITQFIVHI